MIPQHQSLRAYVFRIGRNPLMLRNGGTMPSLPGSLGRGANNDGAGNLSARSGGSARSRVPLSARSMASAISMHVNSYSYLTNRTYDFNQARSTWLRQTRADLDGGGDEGEEAALKRLPLDFEPFFAVNTRTWRPDSNSSCSGNSEAHDDRGGGTGGRAAAWAFQLLFTVFSSRHWDRLYFLLGLSWSTLCPGIMDGVIAIKRTQLALILMGMFVVACVPVVSVVVLKFFFSVRLRSRLLNDDCKRFTGVFFVLATKAIFIPALCGGGRLCERRVHTLMTDDHDGDAGGRQGHRRRKNHAHENETHYREEGGDGREERPTGLPRAPHGGGASKRQPATPPGVEGEGGSGGTGEEDRRAGRVVNDSSNRTVLDLPPRHWMCIVCKKVNVLPEDWTGRAAKVVQVVIKRKEVDKRAMYGAFRAKPGFPSCRKCQTPFNYSFRNGGGLDQTPRQQRGREVLEAALSRPATAARTRRPVPSATVEGGGGGSDDDNGGGSPASGVLARVLKKVARFLHAFASRSQRRRDKDMLIDAGGGRGEGEPGGAGDEPAEPELWYGRDFRRQLKTYFKPQLERPSLSPPLARGGGRTDGGDGGDGDRYPVGARVACFAGKGAWYPGAVTASRENNTYDVRYDNGDIVQHVFSHMIRFEPTRTDSFLLCCYYGLALAAAGAWPLAGSWYFTSTSAPDTTDEVSSGTGTAAAIVALPALLVGVAGVFAVAVQFYGIHAEIRSAGLCITAKFAAIFALPSLSLAGVGGSAVLKALNPASAGSWVQMLFAPSVLFTLVGGVYAHAVSPAYGKAWAAASPPWLLFLLLATLRLDGGRGDAHPVFARLRWLAVYFPLWIFQLMLIAAHQALPYVWDVEVFRAPPPPPLPTEGGGGDGDDVKEKARGFRAWLSRPMGPPKGGGGAKNRGRGEAVAAAPPPPAAAGQDGDVGA